ncbi:hypothetical protein EDD18DRAFT_1132043 [Armillaria luteobubalina]|uniref:Yeast cell wall synthesis Kre9/Knh1-like N-terminal domain-containing protein n=1 Tax=Armillaria luteobubalina TaxID=153913 RepID=A0AA39QJI8_9AGAR|nr:hypothetical protein EDD18DRAFT_1132043 [Armillaria luteobubalina]
MMYAHALLLLLFSGFVHALPLISRDVISPPITSPTAGAVWTVGQTVMVTWNTTVIPPASQVTNPIGKIVLGHQANNSLNLDLDHPLASNFQLTDGQVDITVPDVEPRDDYIIVLFGDSGNTSPEFTIQQSASSSSSGAPASSSSASSLTSLISTPIPITGTEITGGTSSNTPSSVRPSVTSDVSSSISTVTAVTSATSSPSPLSTSLALSSSVRTTSELGTSESSAASTTQAVTQSGNAGVSLGYSRAYYLAVASLVFILTV